MAVHGRDVERLTLTKPVLNAARLILFLVCGISKAQALHAALEGDRPIPAREIAPEGGEVLWLVDRDAAALFGAGADASP